MKLKRTELPADILRYLPEGIKLVKRNGMIHLVMEQILDGNGNSLIDHNVKIYDEPSIKLQVRVGDDEGLIFADAYWGSHTKLYSFIPDLTSYMSVRAFSPADKSSLMVEWECPEEDCDEKMGIEFNLPGGENRITVCSRLGCPGHIINIKGADKRLSNEISSINYFGNFEDEPY